MNSVKHGPSGPGILPVLEAGFTSSENWKLVQRIASSRHFAKSQQLRDILQYICLRSLSEPAVTIKEHEVGCEALGRGSDFDSHEDNIVRVQFGHLRKRLDLYFANEGKTEPVRLVVPKGSYVPSFEPVSSTVDLPVSGGKSKPGYFTRPGLMLVALAAALCAAWLLIWRVPHTTKAAGHQGASNGDHFWSAMFGEPLNIVVSDTCLVMLQDILGTNLAVEDYLSDRYPKNVLLRAKAPELRSALNLIASRQYTSLADLNVASALVQLGHHYSSAPAQIRYSRHLNIREFKTNNFVLLGSRMGIPWVQLFEPQLQFSMRKEENTGRFYFYNKHPRPGEDKAWRQKIENEQVVESYADLAVVPNLGGSGSVMLLNGLTMYATEAVGDLVTGPDFVRVLALLQRQSNAFPSDFEVLLRMRVIAGTSKSTDVVATRILAAADGGGSSGPSF